MMKRSTFVHIALTSCLLMVTGCGGETPVGDVVKGTVTLDGQPLAKGRISVAPTNDVGTTVGAEIVNGKFEFRIKPGPKTVQITSEKSLGKQKIYPNDPTSPEQERFEQIIPARYNTNTELKMDVKKGGASDINFPLESAKPAA